MSQSARDDGRASSLRGFRPQQVYTTSITVGVSTGRVMRQVLGTVVSLSFLFFVAPQVVGLMRPTVVARFVFGVTTEAAETKRLLRIFDPVAAVLHVPSVASLAVSLDQIQGEWPASVMLDSARSVAADALPDARSGAEKTRPRRA